MFVLVCLCRFFGQMILLTYRRYKLVAHFDLFWLRSISGWFLNFKSLFSSSLPSLNLNKFSEHCINYQSEKLLSACKQGVVFLFSTLPQLLMANVLMDISLHADTQHRAVLSVYMRNYQRLKTYYIWSNILVKCLEKIVSCYPQSNASDGTAQLALLFLVLYSIFCPQWSASQW